MTQLQCIDQNIDFLLCIIQTETRAAGRGYAEMLHQRLRAMMARVARVARGNRTFLDVFLESPIHEMAYYTYAQFAAAADGASTARGAPPSRIGSTRARWTGA